VKYHTNSLFSDAEFDEMLDQGYVRVTEHPDEELWILNYTEKAAFESKWNAVTLNCRGLIVDAFNWIVARPFPKFFNYGQESCPVIDLDEPAVVTDKLDGSLGILYPKSDGTYAIATRGSFTSDQALHATELFNRKYAGFKPPKNITMLFEIIYPENRIVCDYGDMDDLVLLGSVDISNGDNWDGSELDWDWPGPVTEQFPYQTTREALVAEPRRGKEGFVVHLLISGVRVKIKQQDYIELHRLVTGLNARSVWRAMVEDRVDQLIEDIPDEFHGFIDGVIEDIEIQVNNILEPIYKDYNRIAVWLDFNTTFATKKDFVAKVKEEKNPNAWIMFLIWDGNSKERIRKEVLKKLRPAHDYSPVKVSNDAD
jgi:RNA ligase